MFDLFVTVLHVALFSGIILIALIMLKRNRSDHKKSKSLRKGIGLFLMLASLGSSIYAQAPDVSRGKVLAEFEVSGEKVRLIQIPRAPIILMPVRFCLVSSEESKIILSSLIESVRIVAKPGSASERVFSPVNHEINEWSANLLEFRQTFDFAGDYTVDLKIKEKTSVASVRVPIVILPYQSLAFDREMGLFILGCMVIGGFLFALWLFLRRKGVDGIPMERRTA